MGLEVRVQRALCIATQACVRIAPRTFTLDPTLVATVVDPEGDPEAEVVDAAEACPTGAIKVFKDGVQIV